MPQAVTESTPAFVLDEESRLTIERLVEADDPVDNPFAALQQHLLFEAIKASYVPPADPARPGGKRKFWAAADVGLFKSAASFLVPDMFLSLDVELPDWLAEKAYYLFEHKPPEIVVEVVSNKVGNEIDTKKLTYASWGIQHYVVYDPGHFLGSQVLRAFTLENGGYVSMDVPFFPLLGIGVTLWTGVYFEREWTYVRWCDEGGAPLLTGDEKSEANAQLAEQEKARADQEKSRADQQKARADSAEARAQVLRAMLLERGIDPGF